MEFIIKMETINKLMLFLLFSLIIFGCAHSPIANCQNSISLAELGKTSELDKMDVLEIAIEVAREHNYPPLTALDKAMWVGRFGGIPNVQIPGLPIVCYIYFKDDDELCINFFPSRPNYPINKTALFEEFEEDFSRQYKEKIAELEELYNRYRNKK
jgi:hypothetical protein